MSFWNGRNVFVTGCTGFLGSWLTEELIGRGANIVGLVRDMVPKAPFFMAGLDRRITIVHGSVEQYDVVARGLNEYAIDSVIHLAAQTQVGVANENPLATFESNIKGTWTLLEACRNSTRVSRVIIASSDKAYGQHEKLPYREGCALQGNHPYDVSKSCADLIALTYHNTFGTPVCVTRCGNLYGPGDINFNRLVPGTIRSILGDERPIIRSDGSPLRDYVFVGDIAAAYLLLAERMNDGAIHGKAFNFSSGEPISVLDLTRKILKAAGKEDLQPKILNDAKGEILHQYLSSDMAAKVLGWRPGAALDARIEETLKWYRGYLSDPAASAHAMCGTT